MHKAYRFRIYPTKKQEILLNKTFGCCRFVFNYFLEKWNGAYEQTGKGLNYNACSKQLTQLKKELQWLKEVDSTALQNALKHLNDSFQRFFNKQNDRPHFKSKKNSVQSYTSQCNYPKKGNPSIEVVGNRIKLPKLGWMKFAKSREVEGRILSATIVVIQQENILYPFCAKWISNLFQSKRIASVLTLGLKILRFSRQARKFQIPNTFENMKKS
jgi:putative transposase